MPENAYNVDLAKGNSEAIFSTFLLTQFLIVASIASIFMLTEAGKVLQSFRMTFLLSQVLLLLVQFS